MGGKGRSKYTKIHIIDGLPNASYVFVDWRDFYKFLERFINIDLLLRDHIYRRVVTSRLKRSGVPEERVKEFYNYIFEKYGVKKPRSLRRKGGKMSVNIEVLRERINEIIDVVKRKYKERIKRKILPSLLECRYKWYNLTDFTNTKYPYVKVALGRKYIHLLYGKYVVNMYNYMVGEVFYVKLTKEEFEKVLGEVYQR